MRLCLIFVVSLFAALSVNASYLHLMQNRLARHAEQHTVVLPQTEITRFELILTFQSSTLAPANTLLSALHTPPLAQRCEQHTCQYSFLQPLSGQDLALVSQLPALKRHGVTYAAGYDVKQQPLSSVMVFEVE